MGEEEEATASVTKASSHGYATVRAHWVLPGGQASAAVVVDTQMVSNWMSFRAHYPFLIGVVTDLFDLEFGNMSDSPNAWCYPASCPRPLPGSVMRVTYDDHRVTFNVNGHNHTITLPHTLTQECPECGGCGIFDEICGHAAAWYANHTCQGCNWRREDTEDTCPICGATEWVPDRF